MIMSWTNKESNCQSSNVHNIKAPSSQDSPATDSLSTHFTEFLKPVVAMNQCLKEESFRIRHHVYCEELGFEPESDTGLETDEFDSRSLFALIKHRPSNTFTSCVRIITSSSPDELLPIEKFCQGAITDEAFNPQNFERKTIAEISRLAVKESFRRRKADKFIGSAIGGVNESNYSETELRSFPFIAMGLYMSAAILSKSFGITHLYIMMEPRLARSMKFLGIKFQQLGEPVNYHGLRAPYYITPEDFIKNLAPNFRILFNIIEKDITAQLEETSVS